MGKVKPGLPNHFRNLSFSLTILTLTFLSASLEKAKDGPRTKSTMPPTTAIGASVEENQGPIPSARRTDLVKADEVTMKSHTVHQARALQSNHSFHPNKARTKAVMMIESSGAETDDMSDRPTNKTTSGLNSFTGDNDGLRDKARAEG